MAGNDRMVPPSARSNTYSGCCMTAYGVQRCTFCAVVCCASSTEPYCERRCPVYGIDKGATDKAMPSDDKYASAVLSNRMVTGPGSSAFMSAFGIETLAYVGMSLTSETQMATGLAKFLPCTHRVTGQVQCIGRTGQHSGASSHARAYTCGGDMSLGGLSSSALLA